MNILHSIKTTALVALAMVCTGNAWAEGINTQEALVNAINSAEAGGTVAIDGDISLSSTINIAQSLTLDLNGHNITISTGNAIQVSGSSTSVTIKDATASSAPSVSDDYNVTYTSGMIQANKVAVIAYDGATLTIESGTYKSTAGNGVVVGNTGTPLSSGTLVMNGGYVEAQEYGVGVYISSTATINGGVILSKDNAGVAGNGTANLQTTEGTTINITGGKLIGKIQSSGYAACGIYHPQSGKVNISGGEIVAVNGPGIVMRAGQLNITGGTITSTGEVTGWVGDKKTTLTCSGIVVDVDANYPAAVTKNIDVDVTGGTITGTNASIDILNSNNDANSIFGSVEVGNDATLNGEIKNSNTTSTEDVVTTLQQIINSASNGSTIKLTKDYTENITIPTDKTITLDLNGHSITTTTGYTIYNYGTLTLAGEKDGSLVKGTFAVCTGNNANTTINSGNYESSEFTVMTGKNTGGTIIINGGTFTATDNAVIGGNGTDRSGDPNTITINGGIFNGSITTSGYIACGIYAPWKDIISVNGGTFNITNGAGIVARAGKVTVNGGTFICTGNGTGWVGDDKNTLPCSAIVYDANANYPAQTTESSISIPSTSTATFTAEANAVSIVGDSHISISGGTYSSEVPEAACAEGFEPKENADGTYGVKTFEPVAKIGETNYPTIAKAIEAAGAEETNIIVLADVTLSSTIVIPAGKNIVLDLNGKTITNSESVILNNGTLTVQDTSSGALGKLYSTGSYGIKVGTNSITNFVSGNIESQEFGIGTHLNTGAIVNISGGTITANDNAVFAGNGTTREGEGSTFNISGGTFYGKIQTTNYIACGIYAPWKDTFNVSGGTFNVTGGAGIVARAGTVNVTGGTFYCTGTAEGWVGDSKTNVPSSAIVYDSRSNYPAKSDESKFTITGGSFNSAEGVDAVTYVNSTGTEETNQRISISNTTTTSPTFSSPVDPNYCANGYSPKVNNDGTYGVTDQGFIVVDGQSLPIAANKQFIANASYSRTMPTGTTWGTVCLPFTLTQGDGTTTPKLYTFGSISENTLTVNEVEVEGTVAPGTPVIFQYSGSDAAKFETTSAVVNTAAPSSGILVGTYTQIKITTGLSSIYFINGDKFHQAQVSLTIPAYRAYINNNTQGKSSILYINVEGETTAINATTFETLGDVEGYYSQDGIRLTSPRNGLNIIRFKNGKTIKMMK